MRDGAAALERVRWFLLGTASSVLACPKGWDGPAPPGRLRGGRRGLQLPACTAARCRGRGVLVEARRLLRFVVPGEWGGYTSGVVALSGGNGISYEVKMSPGESGQTEGPKDAPSGVLRVP